MIYKTYTEARAPAFYEELLAVVHCIAYMIAQQWGYFTLSYVFLAGAILSSAGFAVMSATAYILAKREGRL